MFIYLAAVLLLAAPILIVELIVGRRGNASPPVAIYNVAKEAGANSRWRYMEIFGKTGRSQGRLENGSAIAAVWSRRMGEI